MELEDLLADESRTAKEVIVELTTMSPYESLDFLNLLTPERAFDCAFELSRYFVSRDFPQALIYAEEACNYANTDELKRRGILHWARLTAYHKRFLRAAEIYQQYPIDENELSELLAKKFQIWQWQKEEKRDETYAELWREIIEGILLVPISEYKLLAEHIRKLYGRDDVEKLQDDLRAFSDQMFMHQHLSSYSMLINFLSDLDRLI